MSLFSVVSVTEHLVPVHSGLCYRILTTLLDVSAAPVGSGLCYVTADTGVVSLSVTVESDVTLNTRSFIIGSSISLYADCNQQSCIFF